MNRLALEQAQQLHADGKLGEAEAGYRQILDSAPDDPVVLHHLATVLLQRDRKREAMRILTGLMAMPRTHPDTPALFALACRDMGRYEEGIAACEKALRTNPGDALTALLIGNLYVLNGNYSSAEQFLRRATSRTPRSAEAWAYLGMALHRQGRWQEAIDAYRRSCSLKPDDHKMHFNIALCADSAGDLDAACAALNHARRLAPHRADIVSRLANIHAVMCDFENEQRCVSMLEDMLASPERLEPDDQIEPFLLTFLPLSRHAADTVLHRKAQSTEDEVAPLAKPEVIVTGGRDRPLRVGYISADFGDHAVGSLIGRLFRAHDRAAISVHAYSLKRHAGEIAAGLRRDADAFVDCDAMSTTAVAAAIAGDRIDVLVDLAGYTLGARPAILALRPAPVQIGYLGYLHGYAAGWIDALIVDEYVCPPGSESGYPEPLIRLPGTLFPANPDLYSGTADRARFGLPENVPVFASFNNSYKLDPELLLAWIEIHRRVPDAHFLVYLPDAAKSNFVEFWTGHGGREDRLILASKLSSPEHADRAASCDLFLDAFRYQAGATGVAAVAAGLPLLTREGSTLVSRLGVSINRFLGQDDLVCTDTGAYVERAVEIGHDSGIRQSLKSGLLQAVAASGLLDPRRTAESIEVAIRHAWNEKLPLPES